ncbi:indolepyruvate oxidoreductase subunit beta [Desulfurococcus mucosus]|uniref:indolepyruvate oxidoreductase subunit beta n=1 Tax=Desulfurococcus mucosus TaxID=2275 RepID=UPI001FE1518D|nr:indolepyruvate oxidoreductase subunit beta [Desulfurococcus mucosus]
MNILIASVGGQGGLTLSRILAGAAVKTGLSVRTGETLGMAQRYGSVVSYVRIGVSVHSPVFSRGEADALVGLELVEAVRNTAYLKPRGVLLVADEYKPPSLASITRRTQDRSIYMEQVVKAGGVIVPARRIASEAGNPRAANIVMLGALNASLKLLPHSTVEEAILEAIPGEAGSTSITAYHAGFNWLNKTLTSSPP